MIRLILACICFLLAAFLYITEVVGLFRFRYVLNRMHAAALGDTLGIGVSLTGLILLSGWNAASLKMALIIVFLWLASPVSSHLISRLEVVTNEHLAEHCELPEGEWEDELC